MVGQACAIDKECKKHEFCSEGICQKRSRTVEETRGPPDVIRL